MPYLKFDNPSGFADNRGSCAAFVNYLTKEDYKENSLAKEFFFNHKCMDILDHEVVDTIDRNRKGLGKNDAKFYTGSINFSEDELLFIGNDAGKIKEYTIKVMEQYAQIFNKGITIDNVNWFGKMEYYRYFKGDDDEVIKGSAKQGQEKLGLQSHVHILIGHKTVDGKMKISPKTNHKNTQKGPIQGGFNRDLFKEESEKIFDELFGYLRPLDESYQFYKVKKNGTIDDKVETFQQQSTEKSKREIYKSLTNEQKEYRIMQLSNYICFGNDSNIKQINIDSILAVEKDTGYKGNIYKSLVNLNRLCKEGKTPKEYDLTQIVINYSLYLDSKRELLNEIKSKQSIIFSEDMNNQSQKPLFYLPIESSFHSDNYDEDPIEAEKRKKRKRRAQDRSNGMAR